ncbi:hypothetical protein F2P81_016679 [Scophthalmus maximus]|uniref:Uncharacterized protein n=1 Tax=Scophthalmus maximus TaxID=52904 RepID=A0A6A4SM20_SCOMX|nr:hypothetical protein F2P81_016679 [Scophthalmus maximus]
MLMKPVHPGGVKACDAMVRRSTAAQVPRGIEIRTLISSVFHELLVWKAVCQKHHTDSQDGSGLSQQYTDFPPGTVSSAPVVHSSCYFLHILDAYCQFKDDNPDISSSRKKKGKGKRPLQPTLLPLCSSASSAFASSKRPTGPNMKCIACVCVSIIGCKVTEQRRSAARSLLGIFTVRTKKNWAETPHLLGVVRRDVTEPPAAPRRFLRRHCDVCAH